MIQKVFIANHPDQLSRRYAMIGHLISPQVDTPQNRIEFLGDWSTCVQMVAEIETNPGSEYIDFPCLILDDMMRLQISFGHLEFIVSSAMSQPGEFCGLQLDAFRLPWDPPVNKFFIDGFLIENGLGRGGRGLVLNRDGAQKIIEANMEKEQALLALSQMSQNGFFSCATSLVKETRIEELK